MSEYYNLQADYGPSDDGAEAIEYEPSEGSNISSPGSKNPMATPIEEEELPSHMFQPRKAPQPSPAPQNTKYYQH